MLPLLPRRDVVPAASSPSLALFGILYSLSLFGASRRKLLYTTKLTHRD